MKRLLLMAAIVGTVLAGCKEEKEPELKPQLSVTPEMLNFEAAAEAKSLSVTANTTWTLTGAPAWLSVSPTAGNGNATVSVSATANSTAAERSAELTFTVQGGKTAKVSIHQKAPSTPSDPYATFKADATPRWENGSSVEKNAESAYTFITDTGGQLFESAKYKTGRITDGGNGFEIVEFSGTPAAGKPAGATLHSEQGTTPLHSLEILKIDKGTLWIIFKETETATERRIVQ